MSLPLLSIIIPTFDRVQCVARAVESVFAQTFKNFEVIVVDDGSTDDTAEILTRFGDRIRLIRQEHRGVAAARNTGIRAARGNWIAFLDSDDRWLPDKLERQMKCLEKYRARICFTRCVTNRGETWRDLETFISTVKEPEVHEVENPAASICQARHPLVQSMVIEKKLLEEYGLFDESLHAASDTQLLFKLSFISGFIYVDVPLVEVFCGTANSVTYGLKPEAAARRYQSYLRVQAEMYWRVLEIDPARVAFARGQLASFISCRAELACAADQIPIARALARDGIFLAGDFRTFARCAGIYLLPSLFQIRARKKWRKK